MPCWSAPGAAQQGRGGTPRAAAWCPARIHRAVRAQTSRSPVALPSPASPCEAVNPYPARAAPPARNNNVRRQSPARRRQSPPGRRPARGQGKVRGRGGAGAVAPAASGRAAGRPQEQARRGPQYNPGPGARPRHPQANAAGRQAGGRQPSPTGSTRGPCTQKTPGEKRGTRGLERGADHVRTHWQTRPGRTGRPEASRPGDKRLPDCPDRLSAEVRPRRETGPAAGAGRHAGRHRGAAFPRARPCGKRHAGPRRQNRTERERRARRGGAG